MATLFFNVLWLIAGGGYFPDSCTNIPSKKPWNSSGFPQMRPFWEARDYWLPTWNVQTDDRALQIDYIRVYSNQ